MELTSAWAIVTVGAGGRQRPSVVDVASLAGGAGAALAAPPASRTAPVSACAYSAL
jgi:hypothetical protein